MFLRGQWAGWGTKRITNHIQHDLVRTTDGVTEQENNGSCKLAVIDNLRCGLR